MVVKSSFHSTPMSRSKPLNHWRPSSGVAGAPTPCAARAPPRKARRTFATWWAMEPWVFPWNLGLWGKTSDQSIEWLLNRLSLGMIRKPLYNGDYDNWWAIPFSTSRLSSGEARNGMLVIEDCWGYFELAITRMNGEVQWLTPLRSYINT